jgi:hypothetical protein
LFIKYAPFVPKICPKFGRRFILMIKRAKGVEINKKKLFITHIYTFGSNMLLAL